MGHIKWIYGKYKCDLSDCLRLIIDVIMTMLGYFRLIKVP